MGDRIENPYEVLEGILAGVANPRDLPLAFLEDITDHFSEERKIGEGGFGTVYKGLLHNGETVAVKKILRTIPSSQTQFENEVNLLMKLKHQNIVRLVGYCYETRHLHMPHEGKSVFAWDTESLLCLECLPNGSLDKYISDASAGLNWHTRCKIIEGISYGLHYLHEHSNEPIIHLDLKPANILLDAKMLPKITDFGLSRLFDQNQTIHTASTSGTLGYMSPEFLRGIITPMSDIFSLGVIIMEVITGHRDYPYDIRKYSEGFIVLEVQKWRNRLQKEPGYTSLETDCQQIERCIQIGLICVNPERTKRPTMKKIIDMIEGFDSMNWYISNEMSLYLYDDMLGIEPELCFPLEHNKQTSCSVELTSDTSNSIAFRTPSKQYDTWPDKGIVLPAQKRDVKITLQTQESATQVTNADKFVVHSTIVTEDLADEDIIDDMFDNKKEVHKVNLMGVYEPEKYQVQEEEVSKDIGSSKIFLPQLVYCEPLESISWNLATSLTSDRTVDLATGAIGSLLPKLSDLLNNYNLETSIRSDVDCIIQELAVMRTDLCDVSEVQQGNITKQLKLWADEVRELSYDIEDVVDGFLMHVEGSEPATSTAGLMELIQKMMSMFKLGRTSHQIGGAIKDIKNQVQNKSVSKGKYRVEEVVDNTVSTINSHHLSALVKDREKLFGIDDAMKDFTKMLRGEDGNGQKLKVHSIFGFGGLGKTTLARAVYNQLKGSFRLTAFVSMGRNSNVKKLYYDILFELDERRYINLEPENLDERQLLDELKELLENNRYLIVIDDIWDKSVWDDSIKYAFLDSNYGSKIIITTRIFEVATIATDVYKLEPLSHGYSEELFYATFSPEEGKCEYDVTDEVIEKILSKCGGVPLAIITIASLLASKQREDWPKVYKSIGFGYEFNIEVQNTRKILLFSYSDLPRHLRTCLLHLSIFPEDDLISKDTAIWMWVAEGFVPEEPGRSLFEVGEKYFNQLISRSMIQLVVQIPSIHMKPFSTMVCFRIHDMLFDMICLLSKEENFVTVLEMDKQPTSSNNSARRLSVQKRVIEQSDPLTTNCMVQLRSFSATACHIGVMPPLSSFKVLRVLSMEGCRFSRHRPYHLEHIGKLLQLRYLGLDGMPIRKLPEEMGDLLFLQTLILNGTDIRKLPRCVGLLRQLKCLRAKDCLFLGVPDCVVNMTSLEDLSLVGVVPLVFAEGLSKLQELRNLHLDVSSSSSANCKRAIVKSIGNLLKLQSLQIICLLRNGDDIWEGFVPPRYLHSMMMGVQFSSVPSWMDSTHLPRLSYLELSLGNVEARCLEILGRFPQLHTLKLRTEATPNGVWLAVAGSGAFPKLRQFYIGTMLRFQRGVMPRLEYLEVTVDVLGLEKANFDSDFTSLRNLPSLQKIRVNLFAQSGEDADPEYVNRIEAAVKYAVDTHPHRRPVLHLHGLGLEELLNDVNPSLPQQD